jgi:hypothetical protein
MMFALCVFTYFLLSFLIGASVRRRLRRTLVIALPVGAGVADPRSTLAINISLAATDRQLVASNVPQAGYLVLSLHRAIESLLRGTGTQASGLSDRSLRDTLTPKQL